MTTRARLALATTLAAVCLGTAATARADAAPDGWTDGTTPAVPSGHLSSVTHLDGRTTWAVGNSADRPLLMAREGEKGAWHPVATPEQERDGAFYTTVSAASAHDVWVSGGAYTDMTVPAVHWDGRSWQRADVPVPQNCDAGVHVAAVTDHDAWAAGWYCHTIGRESYLSPILDRWDGRSWTPVPIPAEARVVDFTAISAVSCDDVWATGWSEDDLPVALHYDGSSWRSVPVPLAGVAGELYGIGVGADGGVWAVGRVLLDEDDRGHALIEHWDGRAWHQVAAPAGAGQLTGVTVAGRAVVAVGQNAARTEAIAVRVDGFGATQETLPHIGGTAPFVGAIDAVAGQLTAVGTAPTDSGDFAPAVFTRHA